MSSQEAIRNQITTVKSYLKDLENYTNTTQEELKNNLERRRAIERILYLLAQSVIDLAESVVSLKNFRKPTTLAETFDILQEEEIISLELAQELINMAKFRNIIAHDYTDLDYSIVEKILKSEYKDIKNFLIEVEKNL